MKKRKTRILYLALEMDFGGLQRVVNLLVQSINREYFVPYLVCLDRGGVFYEETMAMCNGGFILGRKPGPFDIKMLARLIRIISELRIDIVHSQSGCSLYCGLAGRMVGVKGIIHTDHGRLIPDKKTAIWEDRISSHMIDRFVAVSAELSEYLKSTVKVRKGKLTTIVNGIDTKKFRPRDEMTKKQLKERLGFKNEDILIGTVCRLDPIKNLNFMVECMPQILRYEPQTKLIIVGDGPMRSALAHQAEKINLTTSVIFLGSQTNIEEVIPAFDLYVCTSLSEGTSMTILEAMACGLPIVASDVGGNTQLVDQSNGVLFPLNDHGCFVDGVIGILNERRGASSKGKESRKKVEQNLSVENMIRKYEKLYSFYCKD
jgi:sugar transferase (PEP-CTERM/EpsH1 system associated)